MIAGILAVIAVSSFERFVGQSRQTEARTQLSALSARMFVFKDAHGTYHDDFAVLGYSPTGRLNYVIAAAAAAAGTAATTPVDYTGPADAGASNSAVWCGEADGSPAGNANSKLSV